MANMFSNDARTFKFDVMVQLAKDAYSDKGVKEEEIQAWARNLVTLGGPRYRCCVYKEREVLRQRVRLAMGKMADDAAEYNPRQIVQVIDAACDGCTIKKVRVTDNCRKCMAKSCMAACHFGAMNMGSEHAEIDYEKCKECGACARACPYNAIVITERPCKSHCPVDAISWDANNISVIDVDKCINCGQCLNACPFGAIEDISWVVPVVELLRMKSKCFAIVAPSIQGQFDNSTLPQITKSVEMLGFTKCYEVAVAADMVANTEYQELREHREAGMPMTTSCCPGFVNMEKIHFPELYEKNKSTTLSPMMALAKKLKTEHPDYGIVFIGPCVAKKQEAMEESTCVDYVLTFEELVALFASRGIQPSEVVIEHPEDYPSNYGRDFAHSGGVAAAVMQACKECGDEPFTSVAANGASECKKQLMLMKFGKFNADILEGMCCEGGCVAGPGTIQDPATVRGRMTKENKETDQKTITESLELFHAKDFDIHIQK